MCSRPLCAAFDNIYEAQEVNFMMLFCETVSSWHDATPAPPPLNLLCLLTRLLSCIERLLLRCSKCRTSRWFARVVPSKLQPWCPRVGWASVPPSSIAAFIQMHENDKLQEQGYR